LLLDSNYLGSNKRQNKRPEKDTPNDTFFRGLASRFDIEIVPVHPKDDKYAVEDISDKNEGKEKVFHINAVYYGDSIISLLLAENLKIGAKKRLKTTSQDLYVTG
jgi:hypothetical protein